MATTLKNIIAEVRTELVQYESAGMLDEISLRNWAKRALKGFGNLVTTLHEKTYLRGGTVEADLYFHSPKLLRLTNGIKKESCHSQCKNLSKELTYSSPYEINILGDYIQTNFSEGFIYLQFFALEKDEEGEIVIPELSTDQLVEYLTYHLKRKALEA